MMKRRERLYHNRPKLKKGFEFTSFSIPAYDCEKLENYVYDEPNYLRNFALMMPTKAIKMPTKKQLKMAWYKYYGKGRIVTFRSKPWERRKFEFINSDWSITKEYAGEPVTVTITKENYNQP